MRLKGYLLKLSLISGEQLGGSERTIVIFDCLRTTSLQLLTPPCKRVVLCYYTYVARGFRNESPNQHSSLKQRRLKWTH